MPNRILKESICTSDSIDRLSAFQETFFYRLIVSCDDYGRMDARPKILASRLFPLKDVRSNVIEDALRALTSAELVTLYEVGGKPFLQMNTWDRHQQVRAKKSKYPSPDDGSYMDVCNCNQMISDDSNSHRNPIQSESNPNPNPNRVRETDDKFNTFWSSYPNKVAKQAAAKAWNRLQMTDELYNKIMVGLGRWITSDEWSRDDGRFIPHPASWLNGKRWEDEVRPRRATARTVTAQQYTQRDYSSEQEDAFRRMLQIGGTA